MYAHACLRAKEWFLHIFCLLTLLCGGCFIDANASLYLFSIPTNLFSIPTNLHFHAACDAPPPPPLRMRCCLDIWREGVGMQVAQGRLKVGAAAVVVVVVCGGGGGGDDDDDDDDDNI